ncbi:PREDICTED: adenylate kinase 7-like [Priapulus caudatus]|uniref:Adenylate kinase 7-like n=1 Tax=Priapulus caudatus TaxID=37621 RepID=A0ABM1EWR0_PRICU|nr:PREDICTED: adenylate kinase 7-like [Priapulus caudatus]
MDAEQVETLSISSPVKQGNKRIFVNNVDLFTGKNIGKYLNGCFPGASQQPLDAEDEEAASVRSYEASSPQEGTFDVCGSLSHREGGRPPWIAHIVDSSDRESMEEALLDCDVIVYNITDGAAQLEEARWAVSTLHGHIDELSSQKIFILLSTVMTWAKSKLMDAEDPDIPFTEEDFRKRRAHPNFKEHMSLEKHALKLGKTNKSKLMTYVVASGLTYGCEEEVFHFFFKEAWHNAPFLPVLGGGENNQPTIHIQDLASVVQNIIDGRPKTKYILAVDDSRSTLEDIIKAISVHLSNGCVKQIPIADVFLYKDITQVQCDMLLVDLPMEASCVKDRMNIRWVAEMGVVENAAAVVAEFRKSRGLLEKSAARANDDGDDGDDDDGKAMEDKELLDAIREAQEINNGRIEDQYITNFFRDILLSKQCQNQGFILDGYPKTTDQAKVLFAVTDEDREDNPDGDLKYNALIMPEVVVHLEAPDTFLKERVINLPEAVVHGTHNSEAGFTRRLDEYSLINTEDETVLNYFDELEIHPERINIATDDSPEMKQTVEQIVEIIGAPRNYGPSEEELEEARRLAVEKKLREQEEARMKRQQEEATETAERAASEAEWAARLQRVRQQESELLATRSVPMRNYLMRHVMPTLTQGLLECSKVRPDDPVDYLAEYLFKNNPSSV